LSHLASVPAAISDGVHSVRFTPFAAIPFVPYRITARREGVYIRNGKKILICSRSTRYDEILNKAGQHQLKGQKSSIGGVGEH
jgi:hypothetical protein